MNLYLESQTFLIAKSVKGHIKRLLACGFTPNKDVIDEQNMAKK